MNRFNKKPTNVFIRPEGYEPQWRPAFVPSTSYDYTQLSNEEQRQYDPAEITGEQGLKFTPIVDDFRRLGENTLGVATSWIGFAGYRAFESVANLIDPTAGGDMIRMEPLNLTDDPTEPDSMNRLEIIAKDLYDNRVPIEDYGYILSASTYGEYEDRLARVKLASPEAREASGFFGKAVGTVADTAALLALGVASDGLLIAGFGTRGAVAGVIENRASMDLYRRMIDTAQEAAKFTNTISRTNLIGRGVAIGLAEQAMIDTLTEQLDPTYRDASISSYVLSGGIYGAVGGFAGRALIREQFGKFMRKAQREYVMGGAYVGAPMDFSWNSASDLDRTVLRQAPVSDRVDQVGQRAADRYMELRNKYQAAGPDADINTVLTPEELQWLRTDPVAQVLNRVEILGYGDDVGVSAIRQTPEQPIAEAARPAEEAARQVEEVAPVVPEQPPIEVPTPHSGKYPWQMTRKEFLATGKKMYHGTSRLFKRFSHTEAVDRYNRPVRQGRFYFTDNPEVASRFAQIGGQLVDLGRYFGDDVPEDLTPLIEALETRRAVGDRITMIDTAGKEVDVPDLKALTADDFRDSSVTVYKKSRLPRTIETTVYGKELDLTDPAKIPQELRVALSGTRFDLNQMQELMFNHEFSDILIEWARANGYGRIVVPDAVESGFKSTIVLEEFIGYGVDAHRQIVEEAVRRGLPVPDDVLKQYKISKPEAPRAAAAAAVPEVQRAVPSEPRLVRPFTAEATTTTRQIERQRQIASIAVDAMYAAHRRGLRGAAYSTSVMAAVEFALRLDQKKLLSDARRVRFLVNALHDTIVDGLEESLSGGALANFVKSRMVKKLNEAELEALKGFLEGTDVLGKSLRAANIASMRRPFRWFLESYGLNREWDDIIEQDRLVDEMWDLYNAGFDDDSIRYGLDENLNRSFIVEFMNNLRNSGARLNRQQFDEMLAELREVVSNPPRLKSGKVDRRARLTRLAEVHNRWVDAGAAEIGAAGPMPKRKITIPDYAKKRLDEILKRVEDERAAAATTAAGTGGRNITRVASDPAEPLATTPDEAVAQMNATHERLNRDIPILNRIYERLPGGVQRAFSQTKFILGNKNPYIRQFGMIVQNARTAMVDGTGKAVSQASTVLEQGISAINAYLSTTLISLRNNYIRYALEKSMDDPITLKDAMRSAFVKGDKKREFYRKVIGVLRGGTDESAAVMEAAKTMRKVMDDIHQVAKDLKIKGLEFMEENYFPRLWRFEVIRDIAARDGGRDDLINLFRKALATAGTDAAPMRQFRDADGNILEFDDIENAAIVFTDKLIAMANRADNAPLTAYDEELSKAIDRLLGPVAGEPKGVRTHRGKGRAILNEKASITASADYFKRGSSDLTLDDLTNLDLPTVMKKYLVSVQGEINAKKMVDILNKFLVDNRIYKPFKDGESQGFAEIEKLEDWLKLANKMGAEMGVGEADSATAAAMKTMIGAIRFEPIQHANNEMKILNELGQDVAGVMLPLVYMAKGGWFAFSAISELSRVATTTGLRQMVAQMPIMADMIKNWYNMDEGAKNFSMLVDQAFHPSTDRLRRTLYQDLQGEMVTAADGTVGGLSRSPRAIARRAAERASAAFADISLLAPITSFSQQLMATSTLQHLYDVAKGQARRMDDTTVRTLGLEPEQYDRIIQFVGNNARTDGTWGMDRVVDLRQLAGDDFDMLKGFIDRAVRTRIQDVPTRGDFHDLAFSFSGKIFTQFRTFSLKSVDNFLFQNASRIAHGDIKAKAQVAAEMSAAALTGALIMYGRSRLQYESAKERGDKDQMKFIEQRLGVEGFIKGGLSSTGEFFLPGMIADFGMKYVVDPTARGFGLKDTALNRPLFDPYGFSQTSLFNTPTGSFISSAYKVSKDIMEQDFNQKTLHNMRLLTPGSNFVGWSQVLDISEQQIADYFNIPPAKR